MHINVFCFVILCQFLCFWILAPANIVHFCFWRNIWKLLLLHPFLHFVVWLLAHLLYCLLPLTFSFTHPFIHLWIITPLSDVDFLYYAALPPLYPSFTQGILDLLDSSLSVSLLQILIFSQQPLKFVTGLFYLSVKFWLFQELEIMAISGIIACKGAPVIYACLTFTHFSYKKFQFFNEKTLLSILSPFGRSRLHLCI